MNAPAAFPPGVVPAAMSPTGEPPIVSPEAGAEVMSMLLKNLPLPGQPQQPSAPEPAVPQPVQPEGQVPPAVVPVVPAPEPPAPAPVPPATPGLKVDAEALRNRFSAPPPAPDGTTPPAEPEGMSDPKQAHAFAGLRAENNRYKREIVPQLEQARKAAEDKVAAITAENLRLKQDLEAREEKIGQLNLQESPQFREKYATREASIRGKLAGALETFARLPKEDAEKQAGKLLGLAKDPRALEDAVADMRPDVAGATILAAQEFTALDTERGRELADWRRSLAAAGVSQAREDVVRSAEGRARLADEALEFARISGNPALNADPGDENARAQIESISETFRGWIQSATEADLVKAAADGFTAPLLYTALNDQSQTIADLTKELEAYRSARRTPVVPWAGAPSAPSAPPAPARPPNVAPAVLDPAADPQAFAAMVTERIAQGLAKGLPMQ